MGSREFGVFADAALVAELHAVRDALSGLVVLVGEVRELPSPSGLGAVIDCIAVRLDRAVASVQLPPPAGEGWGGGAVPANAASM